MRNAVLSVVVALVGCGADESNNKPAPVDVGEVDMSVQADADGAEDMADGDVAPPDLGPMGNERLLAQGPHPVGYTEFDATYQAPGFAELRTLEVKVWYPAVENSGTERVTYSVANVVDVPSEIALEAPDAAEGSFPLVLYSHGSGGEGLLGYPFGENLASWGWIVVAPNHTGNTTIDLIRMEGSPFAANLLHRVTDVTAVLDAVEGGATGAPIDGRVDMENVLAFGHSFGGYTVLAAAGADYDFDALAGFCPAPQDDGSCDFIAQADVEAAFRDGFGDDRIDAIVAQAPFVPQFAAGELAAIDIPVMIQSGDRDVTTPNDTQAEPAWNALDGADDVWVRLPEGAHFTFISICYDLPESALRAFRPDAFDDGCSESFIDPAEALPVLNAYLRAYGDAQLLGSTEWSAVLSGDESLGEGFEVSGK